MRLLIATDVFPPICGGSGWSAYELARGLRAHGHELTIVRPRLGGAAPTEEEAFDGFRPVAFSAPAPGIPFVRNWFRNERFWPRFAEWLDTVIRAHQIDLVHAQHALSAPPSVTAARGAGIPSVCTIRDYWPLCYWTDLMLNLAAGAVCPGCTSQRMSYCLRPRTGAAWPLATPFIPYMQANLRRKQRALAGADALIAISQAVAKTLRDRLEEPEATTVTTIPNPVDAVAIRAEAGQSGRPDRRPYVLFAGKLAANKGASALLPATADLILPLVVAGDGPARAEIEASALGCPIVAVRTGGVGDVVVHEKTGLLARSADELSTHARRLQRDPALAARLGAGARRRVDAVFDTDVVTEQHEALYALLLDRAAPGVGARP